MQSKVESVDAYIAELPPERHAPMERLRDVINANLPAGFEETMGYGMPAWVVPHALYPDGYHCDPKLPLPFLNIASQKNFVALYHMGIYADDELLAWFQAEYAQVVPTKLDMGKSCIRFKRMDRIPFELVGELAAKMTPQDWIDRYESSVRR
ncbi:MAG: DUF1801 domain-containing protein [Pseudomonadota bacterium]